MLLGFLSLFGVNSAVGEELIDIPAEFEGLRGMLCTKSKNSTKAAIYSYGAIVERIGYQAAAKKGYDIAPFCRALAQSGLLALIPLRTPSQDPLAVVQAAHSYLLNRGFAPEKIALLGFSKGGGITLRAAAKHRLPGSVVLMSPALYGDYISDFKVLTGNVLLTLGEKDPENIQSRVRKDLVPLCEKRQDRCDSRLKYPGNHQWFWSVRKEYWVDIASFLDRAVR
jgi:hypothetical protein